MEAGQEPVILEEPFGDIPGLERKAQELENRAEDYQAKAAAIRQIIAGVRALNGDAESVLMRRSFQSHATSFEMRPKDANGPRGPRAVLRVMSEAPDRVWKVVEVKREMLLRGWAPTPKAVEASIKRLREDGKLEPVGYGHYKLGIPPESPENDRSGEVA